MTSASVRPTWLPAPAIRRPISTISDSVAAKLLPRSTTADPSRSTLSVPVPMISVNRANAVAAWSAVRSVVLPRSSITREKSATSSTATPRRPAASAVAAISVCVAGRVRAISRRSSSSRTICSCVPSLTFCTSAHDDSQSIAAFVAAPAAATIAPPSMPAVLATVVIEAECRSILSRPRAVKSCADCVAVRMPLTKPVTRAPRLRVIERSATTNHLPGGMEFWDNHGHGHRRLPAWAAAEHAPADHGRRDAAVLRARCPRRGGGLRHRPRARTRRPSGRRLWAGEAGQGAPLRALTGRLRLGGGHQRPRHLRLPLLLGLQLHRSDPVAPRPWGHVPEGRITHRLTLRLGAAAHAAQRVRFPHTQRQHQTALLVIPLRLSLGARLDQPPRRVIGVRGDRLGLPPQHAPVGDTQGAG